MKKQRLLLLVCVLLLTFATTANGATQRPNLTILVDGEKIKFDVQPRIENGRTLVPVRAVMESLGSKVQWNPRERRVFIFDDTTTIEWAMGLKAALVNGESVTLDVPAQLQQQRVLVPLRFVAETLGLSVAWDEGMNTIKLKTVTGKTTETNEILQKVVAADLNSFTGKLDMQQQVINAEETMNVNMGMKIDVVSDPFGMYQMMTASFEDEEMVSEAYFTEDGFFSYDPMMDMWIKHEEQFYTELLELSQLQLDPALQLDMMQGYIEDLVIEEKEGEYHLSFVLSQVGLKSMLDEMSELMMFDVGTDVPQEIIDEVMIDISVNQAEYFVSVDKETYFPKVFEVQTDLVMESAGETVNVKQVMSGNYSNFNQFTEITVPDEVIESAQTLDQLFDEGLFYDEEFPIDEDEEAMLID